jgi:hypothetical protein
MLCRERRVELWSLNARNVAKSSSDQQGPGSTAGEGGGGVWLHVTDLVGVTTVKDDDWVKTGMNKV